jgi:hypothetical protein
MTWRYISSTSSSSSSSLDSKKPNRNGFCGRWSLSGPVPEGDAKHRQYGRLGCKRWTCPRCGPSKAKRLQRAIISSAQGNKLCRLLTLTLDPRSCRPEDSIPYIRDCWNKFRTSLKRQSGGSISFIAVVELQRSGYAHLHILIDRYIEQGWISTAWQAVGGGRIVHVQHVDIHRIGPYLSKYLTKEMFLGVVKARHRRYTTSRDITLFVKIKSGRWTVHKVPLECLYELCRRELLEVFHDRAGVLQWCEVSAPEIGVFGLLRGTDHQNCDGQSSLHKKAV